MNDGRQELVGTDPTRFTTDHAETRFAGHGRQFEKFPSDLSLAILPQNMDLGRWVDGCAKRKFPIDFRVRRSRFPRIPW